MYTHPNEQALHTYTYAYDIVYINTYDIYYCVCMLQAWHDDLAHTKARNDYYLFRLARPGRLLRGLGTRTAGREGRCACQPSLRAVNMVAYTQRANVSAAPHINYPAAYNLLFLAWSWNGLVGVRFGCWFCVLTGWLVV